MDYGDRKETRFFLFHASITKGVGVKFLITNRVNKQIILNTKLLLHGIYLACYLEHS